MDGQGLSISGSGLVIVLDGLGVRREHIQENQQGTHHGARPSFARLAMHDDRGLHQSSLVVCDPVGFAKL